MEVYLQHCNDYEQPDTLHYALDTVHKTRRIVAKRREREKAAAAAAYATQAQTEQTQEQVVTNSVQDAAVPGSPSSGKRKRDGISEDPGEAASKKAKSVEASVEDAESQESKLKRDRENTSVMVTNLPSDVSQTAIRRYFKEYGHINNLILHKEDDNQSSSALIEFRSPDDADSALLRDQKYFNQSQAERQTRHPPDCIYIQLPSHRRRNLYSPSFCALRRYIQHTVAVAQVQCPPSLLLHLIPRHGRCVQSYIDGRHASGRTSTSSNLNSPILPIKRTAKVPWLRDASSGSRAYIPP